MNPSTINSSQMEWRRYSTLLALIVLFIVLGIITKGDFFLARNFTNLTRQVSVNGILSIGMTLVILTAGIDLSIGSIVALSGVVAGLLQVNMGLQDAGIWGAVISITASVATGLLAGTVNGALIAFFRIPPFVISLGMMVIAAGGALIISNAQAISPMSPELKVLAKGMLPIWLTSIIFAGCFAFWLKRAYQQFSFAPRTLFFLTLEASALIFPAFWFIGDQGIPYPTLIMFIIAAMVIWFLKNTVLGRNIYAVGGNEEAAHLCGINVPKTKWFVYSFMGFLAGLAGVILASRLNSASPNIGTLMELDAIAAVVIGGTSLMGGAGTVGGSLIGAFLIGTLNNGMDLLEIDSNYQMVIKGIIIIFAVWSDSKGKRRSS
jgi:D-xylose transport system permease protein